MIAMVCKKNKNKNKKLLRNEFWKMIRSIDLSNTTLTRKIPTERDCIYLAGLGIFFNKLY